MNLRIIKKIIFYKKPSISNILLIMVFIPTLLIGMSQPQNKPKFNSKKDYHHLYPDPRSVRSLMAICLGTIANDVKDNIDPKDPLASKKTIEEIFSQLQEQGISPDRLLRYWKAHTQPTWKLNTVITGQNPISWSNANLSVWHDKNLNQIGILSGNVVSYKPEPFTGIKCVAGTYDNSCIAIAHNQRLIIFLNQHLFPNIYTGTTKTNTFITSLVFSRNRNILFIGMNDGFIYGLQIEYDNPYAKKGQWKEFCLKKHETAITALACAPNGTYIISTDNNGTTYKWNRKEVLMQPCFEPEQIPVSHTVHKVLISPDSNFIFFKKDQNTGSLFDNVKGLLGQRADNIVSFAPGNRLVLMRNDIFERFNIDGTRVNLFVLPSILGLENNNGVFESDPFESDFFVRSENLKNHKEYNLLYFGGIKKGNTACFTPSKPSLDQLLYKLALEKALNEGKKGDVRSLQAHNIFKTFEELERETLTAQIEKGIKSINEDKIAQEFVANYVVAAFDAQESLESVLIREQVAETYGTHFAMKINTCAYRFWLSKIWDRACKKGLDAQLACLNSESFDYLVIVRDPFPYSIFNSLVDDHKKNLRALKKIQRSGVEKKLRDAKPKRIVLLLDVEQKIAELNRHITTMLCSNSPKQFAGLIQGTKAKGLKKDVKQRIKKIVKQKAGEDQLRSYSWLREIFKYRDLESLFSQEEIDQLYQLYTKKESKKNIASFTSTEQCIDFIKRLPNVQLIEPTKEKLKNLAHVQAAELFDTYLKGIISSCRIQKKSLTQEQIQKSSMQIASLVKLVEENSDILSAENTRNVIYEAQTKLGTLATKVRLRRGMFCASEDFPSKLQLKVAKQTRAKELYNFVTESQPEFFHHPKIDTKNLHGTAIMALTASK